MNTWSLIIKSLEKYNKTSININGDEYDFYLVPSLSNEDLNYFSGFITKIIDDENVLSFLMKKYKPPISGYSPYIGIVLYNNKLVLIDFVNSISIVRDVRLISQKFIEKLLNLIKSPSDDKIEELFNNNFEYDTLFELIENTKNLLLEYIPDEKKVNRLIIQVISLWYLQDNGFLNKDRNYLINSFKHKDEKFDYFIDFLKYLVNVISSKTSSNIIRDKYVGSVIVLGNDFKIIDEDISIPNEVIYNKGLMEQILSEQQKLRKVKLPLLNLLELLREMYGSIDKNMIGTIYEKLVSEYERKRFGMFYTPNKITSYIVENTIEPYLVDVVNKKFNENFVTIDQIIESDNIEITHYFFNQLVDLRVLDPTVGSGHFLESVIEELITIYTKLYYRVKELGRKERRMFVIPNINKMVSSFISENDFIFNILYYIVLPNNLYGVDINPDAIKITKIRLLLKLLDYYNDKYDKKHIINKLKLNIKTGNTLLGYIKMNINLESFIYGKITTGDPDKLFSKEHNINYDDLKKLGTFHWFKEFPEVIGRGGFDIVIGNPPYALHKDINNIVKGVDYKRILMKLYNITDSKTDFSLYFVLRSLQLLREGGYHSFVITNKWVRSKYGSKIRKYIRENTTIIKIIELSKIQIFKDANVDVLIYIIKKEKPKNNTTLYYEPEKLLNLENNIMRVSQDNLSDNGWVFLDDKKINIIRKIEKYGKPLREWNVDIYMGIMTGYNKAFIVSRKEHQEMFDKCKNNGDCKLLKKFLKPVLRGRDIKKWKYNWNGDHLIFIKSGWTNKNKDDKDPEEFFKETLPTLYEHFKKFIELDEKSNKRKGLITRDNMGDYWWELRPCNYCDKMIKRKIVFRNIQRMKGFTIVPEKFYLLNSLFFLTSDTEPLEYILGVLNSDVINWYYNNTVTRIGNNGNRFYIDDIKRIPIPPISEYNKELVKEIIKIVRKILSITENNEYDNDTIKQLENRLNSIVNKLYNLSDEEINIIKNEKW